MISASCMRRALPTASSTRVEQTIAAEAGSGIDFDGTTAMCSGLMPAACSAVGVALPLSGK